MKKLLFAIGVTLLLASFSPMSAGAAPGDFIRQIGAPFFFDGPTGIAVDTRSDEVYVLNRGTKHTIDVFSPSGVELLSRGGYASDINAPGLYRGLSHVWVDEANDRLWVSDTTVRKIEVFNITDLKDNPESVNVERSYTLTNVDVPYGSRYVYPRGFAVAGGKIYIADQSNHRIVVLDELSGEVSTAFGVRGSGEGEFNYPYDVVLSTAQNRLWVADYGNHRIEVFRLDNFEHVATFGGVTSGENEILNPVDMILDETAGLIYVTEYGKGRVNVLSSADGISLRRVGLSGNNLGANSTSFGVTRLGDGSLAVTDTVRERVNFWIDADGGGEDETFLASWGRLSDRDGEFNAPQKMAFHENGNVYVVDKSNLRVQVFNAQGEYQATLGGGANGLTFTALYDVVTEPEEFGGRIFVMTGSQAYVFGPGHGLLNTIQLSGYPLYIGGQAGEFMDDGTLALLGWGEVHLLDVNGEVLVGEFRLPSYSALPGYGSSPTDITVAEGIGYIGVLNASNTYQNRGFGLNWFDAAGSHQGSDLPHVSSYYDEYGSLYANRPIGISRDAYGNLTVAELNGNRVTFFSPNFGALPFAIEPAVADDKPGNLRNPYSAGINPVTREVWVADTGNHRVQIYEGFDHNTNFPPHVDVTFPPAAVGEERAIISFDVSADSPDGYPVTWSLAADPAPPAGVAIDDHFDGTATVTWTPGWFDAGFRQIPLVAGTANPSSPSVFAPMAVTVDNVNRPPDLVLQVDEDQDPTTPEIIDLEINADEELFFYLNATDPDNEYNLYLTVDGKPTGSTVSWHKRHHTGWFRWTPTEADAGDHTVIFTVRDSTGPVQTDSETVTITVNRTTTGNTPPAVYTSTTHYHTYEGNTFLIPVQYYDAEGDELRLLHGGLPAGATLTDDPENGTATFEWTPAYDQEGSYTLTLTVEETQTPEGLSTSREIDIDVSNINQQPEFTLLPGDQLLAEGQELVLSFAAVEPDGEPLEYYLTKTLPGAVLVDHGDGTATISWTPDSRHAGVWTLEGGVRDIPPSGGSRILAFTITVTVTNVNQGPELYAIDDRVIDENEALSFFVEVDEHDRELVTFTLGAQDGTGAPDGASVNFYSGEFSWTPTYHQAGVYTVTVNAQDHPPDPAESITVSQSFQITVNAVNGPPRFHTDADQYGIEDGLLEFTVQVSDPDSDPLAITHTALPQGAQFDAVTGEFAWIPGFDAAGDHPVTFTVTEQTPEAKSASLEMTIHIGNFNRLPVFTEAPDPQTAGEGELLAFTVAAGDPDGGPVVLAMESVIDGSLFDPVAGTFSWTPALDQAGTHYAVFSATDEDDGEATHTVPITVTDLNRPPVLDPVGNRAVDELAELTIDLSATDPDTGTILTYGMTPLLPGALWDSSTGVLQWTPADGSADNYEVTFTVSDDAEPVATDSETITITVGNVNGPPTLTAIGDKNRHEGYPLVFTVSATDADGDAFDLLASGVPGTATFDGGTGLFSWTPDYDEAGDYTVTFTARETEPPYLGDSETITITIHDRNRRPEFGYVGYQQHSEGDSISFQLSVSDPDGDPVTVTALSIPAGASFDESTLLFSWTPDFDDAGYYVARFQAEDSNRYRTNLNVNINVTESNRAPELDLIGSRTVNEGEILAFTATATDPDGDPYTFSLGNAPEGAVITAGGVFSWTPTHLQAGAYVIDVVVTDSSGQSDSEGVPVTVNDVNGPPFFESLVDQEADEGLLLEFTVVGTDPDGDDFDLGVEDLPLGADFNLDSGLFSWTPGSGQAGVYTVTFSIYVSGESTPAEILTVDITVRERNRTPVFDPWDDPVVIGEGEALSLTVAATDPEGGAVTITHDDLPDGAQFDAETGDFSWTPTYAQSGSYTITFTATDDADPDPGVTVKPLNITVYEVNNPPVAAADSYDATEDQTLNVEAPGVLGSDSDPEGDELSAVLDTDVSHGTLALSADGSFVYTPGADYHGPDSFSYHASDGLLDSETVTVEIDVAAVNDAPVVSAGSDQVKNEGEVVSFSGSFTDVDAGDTHTYDWDFGDGTEAAGTLTPSHTYSDNGTYTVTLTVTDDEGGIGSDTLTVVVSNVAPTAEAGPDQAVNEGDTVSPGGAFTDPGTGDTHTISWDFGNGETASGILDPTVVYGDNDTYTVTLTIADDDGGVGSDTLTVVVDNVAPTVDAGPDKAAGEGDAVNFSGAFTDPGTDDTHTINWDFGDGTGSTGTLNPNHTYADEGTYTVTLTVTDDDLATSTDTLQVTVVNVAPTVDAGPDLSTVEGQVLSASGSFVDPGADVWSATVSYGDGTLSEAVSLAADKTYSLSHVYADNGVYTVTVAVDDGDGGIGSDTFEVNVANAAPTVDAGADQTADEGALVELDQSTFNDPGTADVHTATIDWGDGSPASSGTVTEAPFGPPGDVAGADGSVDADHVYADNGTYTATVCVLDDDGGESCDNLTVTITNVAPVAEAGDNATADEGSPVSLLALSFTDAGTLDTHTATINWGDGSPASDGTVDETPFGPPGSSAGGSGTVAATHTYADEGTYTVTLTVTDDDLATSTDTLQVTVVNVAPTVDAGTDLSTVEGQVLSASGSFVDPGADVWSATVSYGDGTLSEAVSLAADKTYSISHVYADNGVYTVTVTVDDGDGGIGSDTFEVDVANAAPTVDAGADQTADEGALVELDQSTFNDAGTLDTHTATIDWGDGSPPAAGTVDESPFGPPGDVAGADGSVDADHVYADNGTYTVTVTVTDDDGDAGSDTFTVTVNNVSPTVDGGANQTADEGTVVQLAPSTFNDLGTADTHTATINWGDGSPTEPGTVTETPTGPPGSTAGTDGTVAGYHVYADNGSYTVTVTVTDDDGAESTSSITVNINNLSPTVDAGPDRTVDEGSTVDLAGSSCSDKGTLDTHTSSIDWGDGSPTELGVVTAAPFGPPGSVAGLPVDVAASHTYLDNGTYTVTVTLSDDDAGATFDSFVVTVENVAPTVDAGDNASIDEGDTFSGSGSFADPGAGDTWTATVDYGDGSGVKPLSLAHDKSFALSHTYANDGTYTVTVTVTDDDTESGTDTLDVTVANVAATAHDQERELPEDGTLAITLTADDPGADTLTYSIVSGPGNGTLSGSPPNVTYAPAGDYFGPDDFTFVVFDGTEDSNIATVSIDVIAVNDPPVVVSVTPSVQTAQYSDGLSPVTVVAYDIDSLDVGIAVAPAWLSAAGNCTAVGLGVDCSWTIFGTIPEAAGAYPIDITVSDLDLYGTDHYDVFDSASLIVVPEDTEISFHEDNSVAVRVSSDGGDSGAFTLTVSVWEADPDLPAGLATAGSIDQANVTMNLQSVGPGGGVGPTGCTPAVTGAGYEGLLELTCTFDAVPVNTYVVTVVVDGGYYVGYAEDVLVVFDPSLGFTTGGGWFYWPGTDDPATGYPGDKTNFGYTMKYNKKGKNIQGNLLIISHLPDGTIYRVKSNALYGLSIGVDVLESGDTVGWASFSGKGTYREPGWPDPVGNHEFIAYVEDHDEPGTGIDRFWLETIDKDGLVTPAFSFSREAVDNAAEIQGGNIVAPH